MWSSSSATLLLLTLPNIASGGCEEQCYRPEKAIEPVSNPCQDTMATSTSVCHRCRSLTTRFSLTARKYTTARASPPRCAIIGSGPAGFYAAHRMLQKLPGVKVDMYEALPTPFGLVRYGVAPDHPEVKVRVSAF